MSRMERTSRRILFVLLAMGCLLSAFPAGAAEETATYTVETVPNVRLANRLDHVSDPDGILQRGDILQMNRILNLLEDSLGVEVAVVALRNIGDEEPRPFATALFQRWGLGKKGVDDGLLILLVTDPARRSVVFETGYGLEGVLPDAICYRLQQRYMVSDFRAGNFSGGMVKGVAAVADYLFRSGYQRGGMPAGTASDGVDSRSLWLFAGVALLFLAAVAYLGARRNRPRRCPRCGNRTLVYRGARTLVEPTYFAEGMAEELYRCTRCGYEERRRRPIDRLSGGGGGPILFGGGGLGGFGGFGGSGDGGGSWGGGASGGGGSESRF